MILIFEFGLILLWVLTGNAKVQLAQYFEVNNLKKKKKKDSICPPKKFMMTFEVIRRMINTYWKRSRKFPFD